MRRPSGHSSWTNLNVSKFEKIVIDATAAAATILKRQITPIRLTLFSRVINFLSSVQRLRPTAVRLELEQAQNFWASSHRKLLSQSLIKLSLFDLLWFRSYHLFTLYLWWAPAQHTSTNRVAQIQLCLLTSNEHGYPNQCQQHQEFPFGLPTSTVLTQSGLTWEFKGKNGTFSSSNLCLKLYMFKALFKNPTIVVESFLGLIKKL